ncbi:FAD-dependent thymidylate synthase [Peribacillus huizhouensis]|uniref:FAD-dependent thymidylate synthase n=1 Tax=Peribacillus huizhouensis TaxID=1501239 RepID=A0ABR6CR90_9BACI|nr:FAD-dependent thymidylate synthase [Peribacillus huizhouensis]MBA9027548.1 thymidylate synthase (FAD) [Peribacillus huizhouensis]
MAETKMNVSLLAHTKLSGQFIEKLKAEQDFAMPFTNGQAVALSAIRTCYSPGKPSEIVAKEGAKYFGNKASDGAGGTEADRLFRQIVSSKHTSTLEHISFTFAIEGVSRALLAQLTRHRVGFSFSVQSQRYVRFGSGDRSCGFDYVVPESIKGKIGAEAVFHAAMKADQADYDALRANGINSEDARAVLPNAAATNLVMTANLRALLDFYAKRRPGNGAQGEIAHLAEELKSAVISVEPWTKQFFEMGAK